MKRQKIILLFSFLCFSCSAQITNKQINKYVDAIYKSEGGAKAKYLYGIRSIKYKNPEEARKICFNSVRNNYARWIKSGQTNEFIVFMGKRFCPIGANNDPKNLNSNWVKNVKYYYAKQ